MQEGPIVWVAGKTNHLPNIQLHKKNETENTGKKKIHTEPLRLQMGFLCKCNPFLLRNNAKKYEESFMSITNLYMKTVEPANIDTNTWTQSH